MSVEEGEAKAGELKVMFIETSAKAGFNIKVYLWKKSEKKTHTLTIIDAPSAFSYHC